MSKLGIQLRVGLSQKLLMTPQLQQAVKVLQLSRMELEQFVQEQIQENPTLEESNYDQVEEGEKSQRETTAEQMMQNDVEGIGKMVDQVEGENRSDVDWEAFSRTQDHAAPLPSTVRRQNDDDQHNYENIVSRGKSLQEYLIGQIGELDFDERESRVAQQLIGNIDDKGYLRMTLEELSQSENLAIEELEDVLDTIQRMDPPGVGARDLKECLLLQLRANHLKNGIVEKIVEDHLSELETRNFNVIAKSLKISVEEVIENVQIIGELEPVPGRQYGSDTPQYIVPDVYVFKVGDEWRCALNDDGLPRLKVSKLYRDMMNKLKAKAKDKEYLKDQVKSAQWLIKSIQQRQSTILLVAEKIVEQQKEFFDYGVEHLKPMILKDIAEKVEVHESTISRVTNNKYMHTPRGIYELKYFFNSSVGRIDGDNLASESVKHMIEEMIRGEDTKKPLSDQKIADVLEERGIQLARRTVAKYREQLNILPSSRRKKYF